MASDHGQKEPGGGASRVFGPAVVLGIANLLAAAMASARSIHHPSKPDRVSDLAEQVESQRLKAPKMLEKAVADQRASE
ncbi:MAG: hypothetical protein FJ314_02245 [SAR202 cluster bacterium]|nr:hypothetical protein [SAR202 cluster bacterium]